LFHSYFSTLNVEVAILVTKSDGVLLVTTLLVYLVALPRIGVSRARGIIKSHRPVHFLETNLALSAVDDTLCARHLYTPETGETNGGANDGPSRVVVVVIVAKSEYRIDGDRKLRVT